MPRPAALSIDQARKIVEYAENAFANGEKFPDTFVPFARGGASTRREALDALYITMADYFRIVSTSRKNPAEVMREFSNYARASGAIAAQLSCVTINEPSSGWRLAVAENAETVESFVAYLKTLAPEAENFWPNVYHRLKLIYPDPTQMHTSDPTPPPTSKPWWRFW